METDPTTDEPRVIRRKLECHLADTPPAKAATTTTTTTVATSDDEVEMDYREIGDTYREYFV